MPCLKTVECLIRLSFNADELAKLERLSCSGKKRLEFLGYAVDLETGEVYDHLRKEAICSEGTIQLLTVLLSHYSAANPVLRIGKLLKFRDLPGGRAFEAAFVQRAIEPIERTFGDKTSTLVEAAKPLGSNELGYGDVSVEIPALKGIPIVYILWGRDEFPASATALFDGSASTFLPTEDLAVLGELTTQRLEQSLAYLGNVKT
jgi:hypothetical protein